MAGCSANSNISQSEDQVSFITLDPGHFHAALVQKTMYEGVSPTVNVYAPEGPDVKDHLKRIEGFNTRTQAPTNWTEKVYTGDDFLQKMIDQKKGNVVVVSGNNSKKTDYIYKSVDAGFNVLADKPMVIIPEKFDLLLEAFDTAEKNDVLLYDIMTERYEITTILQKELSQIEPLFGGLVAGTPDNPAVTKESVHHFFKYVAGNPIKRPGWFFDPEQRGEGLSDVSTHLVDLIQWECFPGQIIDYKSDIKMLDARRWTTSMTKEQFSKVTGLEPYPDYLSQYVEGDKLNVYSNGEMNYVINGVHAKVSVAWNYQAPEGAGDTHYSIMRGNRADLIIRQGEKEGYKPTLYVEAVNGSEIAAQLKKAVQQTLQNKYPGIALEQLTDGKWKVVIPDKYRVGHEAHFAQVTEKYLNFLEQGRMPEWEVPNMIAKYYTTMQALETASK
ncbi:putative oxidoreductase C-terminal domain-containing protein [Anaerohalosphaera lusitana]|nr:putative oxidoreductase C-terminal domain-containing protein [Anaerohalosphaera lusitana]